MNFEERVKNILAKDFYDIDDLAEIVSILRNERGCPWDKVQTHETIRADFLEETYEVLEAIDCDSPEMLREELGDVLLQVVFHTDIEKDTGNFTLSDVADEVCKKLILRHPHVFGDVTADTVDTVLSNWDAIKKDEKSQESYTDTLKSVPKVFPSLMRAQKLGKRASRAGLDFESSDEILDLVKTMAENGADIGSILFLLANAERHMGSDAEEMLSRCCERFIEKFEELEKSGRKLSEISAEELYGN